MSRKNLAKLGLVAGIFAVILLGLSLYPQKRAEAPEVKIENHLIKKMEVKTPVVPKVFEYIEIVDGCGIHFEGVCAQVYSRPDSNSKVMAQLRNGIVLKVGEKVTGADGNIWYKIKFEKLLHPERVLGDWYVPQTAARYFTDVGDEALAYGSKIESSQLIKIVLSEQKLYAYEGDDLMMEILVSTGFNLTPTPIGNFQVFMKTPSRYMQAPQPGVEEYYDLPGVPWNLYFDLVGDVIHGAYWHDSFGRRFSHGCVNLPPDEAKKLYACVKLGAKVVIER